MTDLQKRVVANLKLWAKKRKIPLSHVPDRAGLSRTYFWDILAGRKAPTFPWLEAISRVLEIDPVDLMRPPIPEKK